MAVPDEQADYWPNSPSTSSFPPPGLSINKLAALYPRERLLVHPLRWSDRQVALLNCRIHYRGDRDTANHGNANTNTDPPPPKSQLELFLADRLKFRLTHEEFIETTQRLLPPLGGQITIGDQRIASLNFNQRPCAGVVYSGISVSFQSTTRKTIMFPCFNHDETAVERRCFISPPSHSRYGMNLPGISRLHRHLNHHRQKDPLKDPFLVAVLIAFAQEKRRRAPKPEPPSSSFRVGTGQSH
ncbi:predicted protein [Chaetomium globosum CBS 148.51]|uniref:Uncharacterized protein n=1 Tax=Chaetomium globosum (strain ATCC 6205 / CBS 148.51 / DSM 1962 / NBRC 6347 / NRRL 1970) TaxID=306901 RepID=Q2HHF0_CHAGB|nr:uncharacterized protein CHGG_00354 [Chaetomium globosum CBS 148.51]EAQ92119.1 predicted protein [Chaetomium globosum CBS 148.51]